MILLMFTENVKENKCPDSQLSKSDAFQIPISDSDLDLVRFFLKKSKISRLTKNVNKRALGFKFSNLLRMNTFWLEHKNISGPNKIEINFNGFNST